MVSSDVHLFDIDTFEHEYTDINHSLSIKKIHCALQDSARGRGLTIIAKLSGFGRQAWKTPVRCQGKTENAES